MTNEIMRVVQLPVISEQLKTLKDNVTARTQLAKHMDCTPETLAECKALRAELNREFSDAEARRKEIKTAVEAPYKEFEAVYKSCISDAYRLADSILKEKIRTVEEAIKDECDERLRDYFAELCMAEGVDWLSYEQIGVTVDMASAKQKTPKKLMEQIRAAVIGSKQDVEALRGMENAAELLAEYKQCLSLPAAISRVAERHARAEQERAREAARREQTATAAVVRQADDTPEDYTPLPQHIASVAPETLTIGFRVTDTRERLKLLRNFLIQNHYSYENL